MTNAMQSAATTSNADPPRLLASRWLTRKRLLGIAPFAIAAIALLLRLQGIDWDGGSFYHPDERSIYMRADTMYRTLTEAPGWQASQNGDFPLDTPGLPSIGTFFDKDASPLNPHWFPLGTIIIYILVFVRGVILEPLMDQVRLQDLATTGRTIAAVVDAGSVLLLFFLGRRMFGSAVGLLASTLVAFTVINIQLTHFYRPESFVMLLALATFWWLLNVLERGSRRDHVMLGVVVGLSFAFRASGAPLLVPVFTTYAVLAWRRSKADEIGFAVAIRTLMPTAMMAGGIAFATFAILQPYALLDFHKFFGDLGWETGIARNAGLVPYTLQYIGTPRTGLYEIQQSSLWALGLPLGIVAWLGLASSTVRGFFHQHLGELLLVAWAVSLLTIIVTFEVKFLRYIAPILPIMVLLGSRWLVTTHEWARDRSVTLTRVVLGVIAFVVISTAWYGIAFVGIYSKDHPGIQASKWINENAATGSVVLTDNHWDEGFPNLGKFAVSQLPMYEGDTITKVDRVSAMVGGADYIMAYSNRPWGSITRVPERYEFSSNYYQALFDGSLGYELVRVFERPPSFAGVTWVHDPFTRATVAEPASLPGVERSGLVLDLGWADENVVNYDHPLTLVWRNTGDVSTHEVRNIMLGLGRPDPAERAMLSQDAFDEQRAGGTFSDIFSEGGLNGTVPWLIWLLVIEVITWIAMPLVVRTLRWLPDRGVVLARPLGLLLVSWLVWLGASTGVWSFGRTSAILALLIVAGVSGFIAWRNHRLLVELARRHWRYLVTVEVLFVVAYMVFVIIRTANPDLWHPYRGGEKPMDLSYLTAVAKSTTFPPFDPWYAGGFINYYYFGFVPIATLMRLTAIVPEVAYNLAVPMFFALTFTGAFSVGCNITETLRRNRLASTDPSPPPSPSMGERGGENETPALVRRWAMSPRAPIYAGLATAFLMVVLANLDGAAQLLQAAGRTFGDGAFGNFDFWRSSRLMPGQIAITEFPFWSFLFADLHAHMISLPFQVIAIGLATNVVLSARSPVSLLRRMPGIAWLAFVIGSFAAINTWEVPTFGMLAMGALAVMVLVAYRNSMRPLVLGKFLLLVIGFGVAAYVLWLPFHQNYESVFAGLRISQWRTVSWHYMGIHGLLFFLSGSWVAVEVYRRLPRLSSLDEAPSRSFFDSRRLTVTLALIVAVLAVVLWLRTTVLHEWTNVLALSVSMFTVVTLAGWWLARYKTREAPIQVLLLGMLVLALGIGIGVDFVTAERDIDRMNTVFKFYLNAWVLFSVVAGVGLWQLGASGAFGWVGTTRLRYAKALWMGLLAILVMSSAIYPLLGTRTRIADRFDHTIGRSLDGRAFQQAATYHDPGPGNRGEDPDARYPLAADLAAIDFIRENVEGSPVFLEGVTDQYRWTPRVSTWAGLPVVVGWQWHQSQQRGAGGSEPARVNARIADVRTMYRTSDVARFTRLIAEYKVEYVYVGPTERLYFPEQGLAKFAELARSDEAFLDVFYKSDEVTIYKVVGPAEPA
jgi:YYY domain-containing protein